MPRAIQAGEDKSLIVPCFSTGIFHIKHAFRSGSSQKQITEFNRNVLVYLGLINKPIQLLFKHAA